jgi:hypothetical protein
MKLSAKFLALFLLVGSVGAPTSQAEDAAPAPEALDALHRFLHVDCEVGEDEPALNDLLRHAEALEPVEPANRTRSGHARRGPRGLPR